MKEREPFLLSGNGKVWSYTTLYDVPNGYQSPLHLAIIELAEGPKITAQLTDLDFIEEEVSENGENHIIRKYPQLKIGLPVEMVTRKITEDGDRGLITYGYKFRPVLDSQENKAT